MLLGLIVFVMKVSCFNGLGFISILDNVSNQSWKGGKFENIPCIVLRLTKTDILGN